MKKLVYLLSSLMLVFTACDPMEDVYEELDSKKTTDKTRVETTLVKADYEVYKSDNTVPHVAKELYFVNEDEAAALIPAILNKKFPHLGNGAAVTVNYNTLAYPGISNTVASWEKYTVTAEDYTANGEKFPNFNSSGDMVKFLGIKYTAPVEKQLVVLTYDYFANNTTTTITDSFYYLNGKWENIYHVTAADYASVRNTFGSFSGSDAELIPEYFNKFLNNEVFGAKAGDVRYVSYYFYDSGSKTYSQRIMSMGYNGSKWVSISNKLLTPAKLKFKKKENVWEPDLSTPYSFVTADYIWVAENPAYGTEANRKNLKDFGNFYQSNPNSSTYWSDEQIAAAIAGRLDVLFPTAEVESKYEVSFVAYKGGNTTRTMVFIKGANGKFSLYVEE